MEETTTTNWDYAFWTFRTGTRTFDGVEILLENIKDNFQKITSHPCGSFSDTKDIMCRNAFSTIALTMSYALLEGFFIEEYSYYIKKKPPKGLINVINEVLAKHALVLSDWDRRCEKIDVVRKLRNAEMHNNGAIDKSIGLERSREFFGEDIFEGNRGYARLSLNSSISLVREFRGIAREYAEAVFRLA